MDAMDIIIAVVGAIMFVIIIGLIIDFGDNE